MDSASPRIELDQIRKTFGSVVALRDAKLALHASEIHGLVGENGAGKSTLIKVITGVHRPDSGQMLMDGEQIQFEGPSDALRRGIAVIYQEPSLFDDLSIAENVWIGRQPLTSAHTVDYAAMERGSREIFTNLGIDLDPRRAARGLSIADQQMVEIAKAISQDAEILIMDEPTAALSGSEVERLFSAVRGLRERGAAILFISHRFEEIQALCQRVTVMRDGAFISSDPIGDVTIRELIRRMVGRSIDEMFPKLDVEPGEVVLEVESLASGSVLRDVSFTVRSGEIVALAGLVGSGRSEIVQSVFGTDRRTAGTVRVNGVTLPPNRPRAAIRAGIGMVPEDRRQKGLILAQSILENAVAVVRRRLASLGFLKRAAEQAEAEDWTTRLRAKFGQLNDPVATLSGGNQQKIVLAKWLATNPAVLIVDEPTRGIDVGTKAEVHRLISELASEGMAVLMVSSELPEVLGMADRVVVVREGTIAGELDRSEATQESIIILATGSGAAQ